MTRLRPADAACLVFLAVILLLILFGEQLAPHSAIAFDPVHTLEAPSLSYPFGTDEFGRDVFSRVLAGARPTLLLAVTAAAVGVALGTVTGLFTGYAGGAWDEAIMRGMDALMSFPGLVLAMLIIVMLGPDPVNVVLAIAIVFWPRSARLIRAVTMDLAGREFIEAARSRGEGTGFILFRELLPNVMALVAVDFSLRVTAGILLAASLAYLGIGVTPPVPAWGLMVHDGQPLIELAPWLVVFPCAAIAAASIGAVAAGERLRRRVAAPGRTA